MTRRISIADARASLSDVTGSVYHTGETVILERHGKPVAVLISPAEYERYREFLKRDLFEAMRELQALNADKDPDEVLADVTRAVEEVRREQRGQK
ncbi:MAG TPA: type II toxin-antitoxin system Phd/YefM family antitoxin [Dehalococcoidia bacterium]|nr:type II toxin-antitoxin system Phd/YefM family antitoxin [Dehalococcoidia bacterium]